MTEQRWSRLKKLKDVNWTYDDVLETLGLFSAPVNVIALAKGLDIDVFSCESWPDEVSGEVSYDGKSKPRIVVNRKHAEVRQRFTIAHEIGHVLLHLQPGTGRTLPRDSSVSKGPLEVEANKAAAKILVPFRLLRANIDQWGWDSTVLATVFNVSVQMMNNRLKDLRRAMGDKYV